MTDIVCHDDYLLTNVLNIIYHSFAITLSDLFIHFLVLYSMNYRYILKLDLQEYIQVDQVSKPFGIHIMFINFSSVFGTN